MESVAEYSSNTGFAAEGGTLTLFNDRAIFNFRGLYSGTATLYFTDCLIANNTTAYFVVPGGTLAGTIPGTSLIAPGQATMGTLSIANMLQ